MEDCSTVSAAAIGRGGVRTVKAENRESYILKWNAGMCCRRRRLSIPILKNHLRRHGRAMIFWDILITARQNPVTKIV